jgi:YidC/Oxa1 family membrane protein insertase
LLLAFGLSMALILAYQVFYYMPRTKRYEEARQIKAAQEQATRVASGDTLARRPAPDTLGTGVRAPAAPTGAKSLDIGLPVLETGQAPKRVTVRTPLYDMVLTGSGAEIASVRLVHFKTAGQPVELISQDKTPATGGMADATLVTENGEVPLARVAFDVFLEGSAIPLQDGAVVTVDAEHPEAQLAFRATGPGGGSVERDYTVAYDTYVIRTGVRFGATEVPEVRSVRWGLGPGLQSTEANAMEDFMARRASLRLGEEFYRKKGGSFDENYSGTVNWVALQIKYFIVALLAPTPTAGEARLHGEKAEHSMTASIELPAVEKQGHVDQTVDIYLGPIDFGRLKSMGRGLEKNVEMGSKYFRPVSAAVLWSLLKLHAVIPNYGLVIIILSVLTKVLFYRLTHKSFKSMREMQALQPKLQALKEKYKNDKQRLGQETMKLYKEAGVNPLGGCLPMVLQMPVFIALFNVLRNTIELRQAPFFGWVNDLSQQDVLLKLPVTLPMLGSAVSVLPIAMGASMLLQTRIGGSIAGPESSATQSKMFQYMMPVVFTVLFYRMPSGLVVYWIINTVLSIAQQYYINKGVEKAERQKLSSEANKTG